MGVYANGGHRSQHACCSADRGLLRLAPQRQTRARRTNAAFKAIAAYVLLALRWPSQGNTADRAANAGKPPSQASRSKLTERKMQGNRPAKPVETNQSSNKCEETTQPSQRSTDLAANAGKQPSQGSRSQATERQKKGRDPPFQKSAYQPQMGIHPAQTRPTALKSICEISHFQNAHSMHFTQFDTIVHI